MVIKVKKFLSLILACVICAVSMSVVSFAETQPADNLFGVITDANGTVVEVIRMTRTVYDNSIYTIPAGGSFISYQYEPSSSFHFGFTNKDQNNNTITDSRCKFNLSIETSNSIGSDGKTTWRSTQTGASGANMRFVVTSNSRRYCNGVLKNTSSYSARVRVIIVVDEDADAFYDYV